MDCSECKHSVKVVGSSHHLSCKHPALDQLWSSPFAGMLPHLTDRSLRPVIPTATFQDRDIPVVILNPHGVINGWAFWPYNFDQIWVKFCLFRLVEESGLDKLFVEMVTKPKGETNGNETD